MPFKSEAQRKYFNAHRAQLEAQGVNVDEWNRATAGKTLPDKAPKDPLKSNRDSPLHKLMTKGKY